MITDSQRTADRTWLRPMPTARSSPSSRMRSWIDSPRVLAMPNRAISTASANKRVDHGEHLVDPTGQRGLELGVGLQAGGGIVGQDTLDGRPGLACRNAVGVAR